MKPSIRVLDEASTLEAAAALGELLADAVEGGASVGFDSGLDRSDAAAWWRDSVAARVRGGSVLLLVAELEGVIAGTVQLVYPALPNGRRRAEVAKLLVHSTQRRRGIARALMTAVEGLARADGRRLLILDTETGSEAERLYTSWGWSVAAVVPDYFIGRDGDTHPTTFMYRRLP